MKVERKYISSYERLHKMGPVFTLNTLLQTGLTKTQATQYIWRWSRAARVRPLGGRSNVYFNLAVSPDWPSHIEEAVRLLYPAAVRIGAGILAEEGMITQHAHRMEFAIPVDAPRYRLDAVIRVVPRSIEWYHIVHAHLVRDANGGVALPPAWAMADGMTHNELPGISVDDLYWPDGKEGDAMRKAFAAAMNSLRAMCDIPFQPDIAHSPLFKASAVQGCTARKSST